MNRICIIPGPRQCLLLTMAAIFLGVATHAATIDFARDIRPLLNKHCTACHGGVKKEGGVSFVFRELATVAGKSGEVPVKPGDLEHSEAYRRITTKDDDDIMPPRKHGPGLTPQEAEVFKEWIKQGAPWQGHWAYTPPQPQVLPKVSGASWCRQDLDRFILAKLKDAKLKPSPDADRAQWLRRVTFDLTGLPPTPDEVKVFLADKSKQAHEHVVDRLLKSERFGERWAALWLDLSRYADSQGYEKDSPRTIWPYRDWLIRAFNSDMPFDQFTIRQIAGDLLPDATLDDIVATGFHRNTPTNVEGGTDDEEFRVAAVLDRVSTTWAVWEGVTFNCVQCHAHPYDPFDQPEFYKFVAFYNTSRDWDLREDLPKLDVPLNTADFGKARDLDRKIRNLMSAELKASQQLAGKDSHWRALKPSSAKSTLQTKLVLRDNSDGTRDVLTEGTVSHDSQFTIDIPLPEGVGKLTALRVEVLPRDPAKAQFTPELGFEISELRAQLLTKENEAKIEAHEKEVSAARAAESKAGKDKKAELKKKADQLEASQPGVIKFTYALGDELDPFDDAQATLRPDKQGWGANPRMMHARHLVLVPDAAVDLPRGARLRLIIRQEAAPNDLMPLVMNRSRYSISDNPAWQTLTCDSAFAQRRSEIASLEKERKGIKSATMPVMMEQDVALRRGTATFKRGNWLDKGDAVQAAVPKVFPQLPANAPADRLAMARWMVSKGNPLTARVAVNRFWEQLFGTGLVASLGDFGTSGKPPSHPELLDYLALRFQNEMGCSIKKLLRELVLSSTYMPDNRVTPKLREKDPQNRLLSRGPRTRLSAEMIRDNALAVAGLLSDKAFGPPVMPVQPDGIWRAARSNLKWQTSKGEDAHRRALYTYIRRSSPYPSLLTFDAPNRLVCAVQRVTTSTPLQALVTLNDPVYMECAVALAGRMCEEGNAPAKQIALGYRLATGRDPSKADVRDLEELYASALKDYQSDSASAGKLGGVPEKAALALVANAILNLDVVLTK